MNQLFIRHFVWGLSILTRFDCLWADCLHLPSCFIAKIVKQAKSNNNDNENEKVSSENFQPIFSIPSEAHDFSLSIEQMKSLSTSKDLFLPPVELFSWSKKIIDLREQNKQGLSTTIIPLTSHKYSHFWMYPKEVSAILQKLTSFENHQTKKYLDKISILEKTRVDTLSQIKTSSKKFLFILTHDSLKSFFQDANLPTFVLHEHSHHHSSSHSQPKLMKKWHKIEEMKDHQRIWIVEEGIKVPQIFEEKRKTDVSIAIQLDKIKDDIFEPLEFLLKELHAKCLK